ncbi:MAG TPA: tRNA uracil 4-sulfurtransferase ThiI [Candidatus Acidoferrum sp.]|nr:tRNA uracil 4-sulfurtransferase ThiI [Candidatus Acidoferrum sp.]
MTPSAHIVVHYHELWLKRGNRRFFLHKLREALRRALDGIPIARISRPADRLIVEIADASRVEEALRRLTRVSGISHLAIARVLRRPALDADPLLALQDAAWEEIRNEPFATFAVRARRSDKGFPLNAMAIEREVGGYLLQKLRAAGRQVRVDLSSPERTCRIEITRGPLLVYARRILGPGGLPPNTAGRLICLLSGGFDSAVAAYKMMKRGAHLSFIHFWGGGAAPGESSVHIAHQLVQRLLPWQFTAKLYLVPFEPLQREIAARAPEAFRILLYRRLMLRVAERIALRGGGKGLITGDSLGQVASQTLQNLQAVGSIARLPLYRPLIGDDKLEIQEIARRIGTHDISEQPFHDCCPVFQSRSPALFATSDALDAAESALDIAALVDRAIRTLAVERYRFAQGKAERVAPKHTITV